MRLSDVQPRAKWWVETDPVSAGIYSILRVQTLGPSDAADGFHFTTEPEPAVRAGNLFKSEEMSFWLDSAERIARFNWALENRCAETFPEACRKSVTLVFDPYRSAW